MFGDTEQLTLKTEAAHGVVLPDGTRPVPLGSGSIAGLLGVGGMSNVYKIWNPQMERFRAVKLMKPDLSADSRRRFQTEIKITAALSHPNIIEIHSVGEWNTLSYIEMEYIDGSTLADRIQKTGALPIPVCVAFGVLITRALTYAHDKEYVLYGKPYRGLIHRDLKPSNIMIASDGRVKLMDFGIARPVETSLMTLDGAVMGTMQYLAPEQIDGKNVGVGSDIYSLGSILYEAITGRKAFPQKNLSQLMSAKTDNIFIPLRLFKTTIPRRLRNLVGRCMHLDPAKRPPSAAFLLEELDKILRTLTPDTPENTITGYIRSTINNKRTTYGIRRRLPVIALAAGVLAGLLAGAIIGFTLVHKPRPEEPAIAVPPPPVPEPPAPVIAPPVALKSSKAVKTKPAQKPSPVPAIAGTPENKAQERPATVLERLRLSSGLTDPLEILIAEAKAGRHANVLSAIPELPPELADTRTVRILELRSLFALDRTDGIVRFFQERTMDDGEFYLLKGRYLLTGGDIDGALRFIEKSVTVAAAQRDAAMMRRDYLFYRAIATGLLYDRSPDETRKKAALDGWFEVKQSLRNYPDHAYFRKAVTEMQKIGAGVPARAGG